MTTKTIFFTERQKFTQIWLWVFLIGLLGLFIYIDFKQLILDTPVGNRPAPDIALILITLIPFGLIMLFGTLTLKTEIKEDGLYYKFSPFHWYYRHISWDEIDKMEVKKYNPINDFLGWGIRWNLSGNGRAYNVKGNQGLQLVLKNGQRILFGTQRQDELRQAIDKIKSTGSNKG